MDQWDATNNDKKLINAGANLEADMQWKNMLVELGREAEQLTGLMHPLENVQWWDKCNNDEASSWQINKRRQVDEQLE